MKKYLTPNEVAEQLSISSRTVYRLLDENLLQGFRIKNHIRILSQSLEDFILKRLQEYNIEKMNY